MDHEALAAASVGDLMLFDNLAHVSNLEAWLHEAADRGIKVPAVPNQIG